MTFQNYKSQDGDMYCVHQGMKGEVPTYGKL